MDVNGTCKDKSEIVGCAVEISSEYGCTSCLPGFFSKDRTCSACNATFDRCAVCTEDACGACNSEHVLAGGRCVPFRDITHCTAADNSQCTKCSFWHAPTASGDGCETHAVWWVILLAVLVALLIFAVVATLVVVVVVVVVNAVMRRIHEKKQLAKANIFKMAKSNVEFVKTRNKAVVVSTKSIVVGDGLIPVCAESGATLYVGNTGKENVRVQFVAKEGGDKFTTRSEPAAVTLYRGMACEFQVFITPLCSTAIDDKVVLFVQTKDKKTDSIPVGIKAETEVSSKLHYDDVFCDKQIGHGSFGVVFRGKFKGNDVAVKKMKDVDASEKSLAEFEKEIAMLDKFRCEQIVHFYGACFIPNHIMMVTEFAPCGSLLDCIKKRAEPDDTIKLKILLDAAKGLEYQHSNGVLHRDIKPDNILVFSLDEIVLVNGKLTDFGSSRNVNLLMTNMTFTKGIGSPTYMAPEILNKEKYKSAADVFSFGIMLFECLKWGEAYPKSIFKFPWDVVTFVSKGEILKKEPEMSDEQYALIRKCLTYSASDRIGLSCPCLSPSAMSECVSELSCL